MGPGSGVGHDHVRDPGAGLTLGDPGLAGACLRGRGLGANTESPSGGPHHNGKYR
jgi:hypothetical protein